MARGGSLDARCGEGCSGRGRAGCHGQSQEEASGNRGLTWDTGEPLVSTVAGAQVLVCWSCAALRRRFTLSEP